MIADVNRPILGSDFLENVELIIDIKDRRIVDNLTSILAIGEVKPFPSLGFATIQATYLTTYPINPAALDTSKKPHNATHCIITK